MHVIDLACENRAMRGVIVPLLVNAATATYANSWAGRLHAGVTFPHPPPSPPLASPSPPPPPDAWGVHPGGAATMCPPGWNSAPNTTKCMRLLPDPETHAHCEHACAAHGGSLACIQTPAEDGLAAMLTFTKFGSMIQSVWTGEYQYPPEPSIRFALEVPNRSAAYTGQPHWGTCSNGQNTSFSGAVEYMNATFGIAPLEPLTAPDGPKDGVNDWCTSSLTGNAFGQPWQQARPHPADDLLHCPSVGAVPLLLIAFFIITCVLPVPLETWLAAAITKFSSEVWREQGYDAKKKYPAGQA